MKGTVLDLQGKSNKGKQRIKQYGSTWILLAVIDIKDSLIDKDWYIAPITSDELAAERWVRSTNDPDFEVKVIS